MNFKLSKKIQEVDLACVHILDAKKSQEIKGGWFWRRQGNRNNGWGNYSNSCCTRND